MGKSIQRMEADKIVRLGLSHVPEGREVFPFLTRARKPDDGRLSAQGPRRRRRRPGTGLRLFPAAEGAPRPAGRPAVRRRAADAGDRPRADEPADTAAAGRALARPVADPGEGDFHDHPPGQRGAGHVDPAGRAERQDGAGNGPLRLCAGDRPRGDERHLRAADAFARTSRSSISAPRKRARGASGAGRRRRRGVDAELGAKFGSCFAEQDRLSRPAGGARPTSGGNEAWPERQC